MSFLSSLFDRVRFLDGISGPELSANTFRNICRDHRQMGQIITNGLIGKYRRRKVSHVGKNGIKHGVFM
jgi:hypothetical protein